MKQKTLIDELFRIIPELTSSDIGKAIGRSRQAVDSYISDLRAVIQLELDIKIFRMNRLGIPQERIAKRSVILMVRTMRLLKKRLTGFLIKVSE